LHQVFDRATDMAKSVDTYLNVSALNRKYEIRFIKIELAPILKKAAVDFKANAIRKMSLSHF